jgi:hypothetical protein
MAEKKSQLCTFSFDEKTKKILELEAEKLHLSRSGFLRFLIWNYNKKSNMGGNQ